MGTLAGPGKISGNGQVALPKVVMAALGLQSGDHVMFRISDEDPEVIHFVPMQVMDRRLTVGERAERLERMTAGASGSHAESVRPADLDQALDGGAHGS